MGVEYISKIAFKSPKNCAKKLQETLQNVQDQLLTCQTPLVNDYIQFRAKMPEKIEVSHQNTLGSDYTVNYQQESHLFCQSPEDIPGSHPLTPWGAATLMSCHKNQRNMPIKRKYCVNITLVSLPPHLSVQNQTSTSSRSSFSL